MSNLHEQYRILSVFLSTWLYSILSPHCPTFNRSSAKTTYKSSDTNCSSSLFSRLRRGTHGLFLQEAQPSLHTESEITDGEIKDYIDEFSYLSSHHDLFCSFRVDVNTLEYPPQWFYHLQLITMTPLAMIWYFPVNISHKYSMYVSLLRLISIKSGENSC